MRPLWFFVCLISPLAVCSQTGNSYLPDSAAKYAYELYAKRVMGESLIYNGTDYVRYIPLKDEHPFFLSDDWLPATISYDDQVYEDVWMYYNTFTDNVIIENYNFSANIQLIKERIDFFVLEGRRFILAEHSTLPWGFYELAYDGETRVLVKHFKQFHESIQGGELIHKFLEKARYYVYQNNAYHQVKSKGSVLKLLKENRREINQEFRKTHLQFSAEPIASIAMLARLNDQINSR